MGLRERLKSGAAGAHPTPVAWRDEGGLFIGHDGNAWLYRVLPQFSLIWEDEERRDTVTESLRAMLNQVGRTSREPSVMGTKIGSDFREFHLLSLSWNQPVPMPEETPQELDLWLADAFSRFRCGDSMVAIGVKLRRGRQARRQTFTQIVTDTVTKATKGMPDPKLFAADRAAITSILNRAGGLPPTNEEALRMETWWNGGSGGTSVIAANPEGRSVSCDAWPEGIEMSALIGFEDPRMDQERLWVADAFGHVHGCIVFSVRGELWPSKSARHHFRKVQRKAIARIEDQADTGDLARDEDSVLLDTAKELEDMFTEGEEPLIRNASVIFGRRASYADDTYADHLERAYGLEVKVLEYRQVEAMEETLPCGLGRLGKAAPFSQDFTVGVLAGSGVLANSKLGDDHGVWVGLSTPDMVPVWIDPEGAAKANLPPAMIVIGEPGAGKTFYLQMVATQASLMGKTVVMVNPKPDDSLDGFAKAIGGNTIKVSSLEGSAGMLDPFQFAPTPESAVEIAMQHISCVAPLSEVDLIETGAAMKNAAISGMANCVGEALHHPNVPQQARDIILKLADADSLFRLGIASRPMGGLDFGASVGLTLIEFDRQIPLPPIATSTKNMEPPVRSAVAAVRLICRAALEQMFRSKGGVLILDEAHVFLGSDEGRAVIQRLGREGRSQRILPVLATQRIADVLAEDIGMASYLSRATLMKMTDDREVEAALRLCGLKVTDARKEWLATAGPRRGERGALALYKDLEGRVGSLMVGPVPPSVEQLFSTNPLDRDAKEAAAAV